MHTAPAVLIAEDDEGHAILVQQTLRDAGLTGEPIPYLNAAWANRLREMYPPLIPLANGTNDACSVCTHVGADAINAWIAQGRSYREIAQAFSLSKSAIGRHVQHGEGVRAHFALARTRSKNSVTAACASCPPSKPRHSVRSRPTSS